MRLAGRDIVHFGSSGYLGLETDARLRDGAIDAVCRYGTQFGSGAIAHLGTAMCGIGGDCWRESSA